MIEELKEKRVVMKRVIKIEDIEKIGRKINWEMEVLVLGGIWVMEEGRW